MHIARNRTTNRGHSMLPFEKFHGHGYVDQCPRFMDIEALQIRVPKSGAWPLSGFSLLYSTDVTGISCT